MNDKTTQPKSPIGSLLRVWQKSALANIFKKRRFDFIDSLTGGRVQHGKPIKILELGCGKGEDFIRYAASFGHEIVGLDINDRSEISKIGKNISFVQGCVTEQQYSDNEFDLVVSLGTLEHVEPIRYLNEITCELDRISKTCILMVPSISTILEPHTLEFFWQLRSSQKKKKANNLNFYSDEAWKAFDGLAGYRVIRHTYMPLISSQYIVKTAATSIDSPAYGE
tara:strand:- start:239 stop:910 length:672 start_codon:yes stop_codon:yes gene_type:complete